MWLHRLCGWVCCALTMYAAFWAWFQFQWYIEWNWHGVVVFPLMGLFTFLVVGGEVADRVAVVAKWNTRSVMLAKVSHAWRGYFVIVLGQACIFSGLYYKKHVSHSIEWYQLAIWLGVFGVMELVW